MTLQETIKQLPKSAGIYQYFDKDGHLLYVGKAKDLSKRVKSYFVFSPDLRANSNQSSRIIKMISEVVTLNYIVVNSEHDALVLENSLIKQLNPKYNILLRDDKTYPYIYIDNSLDYPRFEITRKVLGSKDIKYFGPYSVGAGDIVDSLYEICKLVQKKGSLKSKKICLYHQIGRCLAPCELSVTKERYKKELELAQELILNKKQLIAKLKEKMEFYAQSLRFEEAVVVRDRIDKISRSEIKSDIDFATNENYDIFVVKASALRAVVVRIFMRNGKIVSSSHSFVVLNEEFDESEFYERAIVDFYTTNKPLIVAPILIEKDFENISLVQSYLSEIFEKKASIKTPKIGNKKDLIELAVLNAKELLRGDEKSKNSGVELEIKELFLLQKIPKRIEIFDNSHMSGVATVGAMAVYDNGEFDKKSYRTYHLDARDEYTQMREVLTRRVQSFSKNPPPDLWIIDGGATLLSLACEILESSGVFLDAIAISKEKIDSKAHRAKGKANDILHSKDSFFELKNSDKRLQWVQNMRDEAHRCAINFHKKTKLKLDNESRLLTIKGISQAKIVKLLKHFETFEALKKLSMREIAMVLNEKDAKIIKEVYC